MLKENYGSAMAAGFGIAMMEIDKVERASDKEIIEMARKERIIR